MTPLVTTLSLLMAAAGQAQELGDLVQAALDQPVEIAAEGLPISQAFQMIADRTGVQIVVSDTALECLPYGKETKVTVQMRNIPLREGLDRLTEPLGLRWEARSRDVEVLPLPALCRICRRATWDELDTLRELRTTELNPAAVDKLADRVQFQVEEGAEAETGREDLKRALRRIGTGRGDEVLTVACRSLGWTWSPSEKGIAVRTQADQIRRQLQRPISLRANNRSVVDVVQQLGRQVGVPVRIDPAAVQRLPAQVRNNFSLILENKTASEALDVIGCYTGLGYRIEPEGVVLQAADEPPPDQPAPLTADSAAAARSGRDPYVGKIVLPPGPDGTVIELLLHESDLSAEVNELRKKHIDRANQTILEALQKLETDGDR